MEALRLENLELKSGLASVQTGEEEAQRQIARLTGQLVSRDKELEAVEAQLQEARGSREQLARESEAEIGQREDRILILKKEVSGLGGEVERAKESAREMKEALKCAKDGAWSARAEHEDSIRDLELTLASSRRREEELETLNLTLTLTLT